MKTLEQAAQEFLSLKRIAVAGVSRKGDTAANGIYKKLRKDGYIVFPINPNADQIEGDHCYKNLSSIPDGVEGVVIGTHPSAALQLVRECGKTGVKYVWMHNSFGKGSVDDEAVRVGRELGLFVIPGSCPMMFAEPVDVAHKCIRWFLRVTRKEAVPVG